MDFSSVILYLSNSFLRSVGKLDVKNIDKEVVARHLLKEPSKSFMFADARYQRHHPNPENSVSIERPVVEPDCCPLKSGDNECFQKTYTAGGKQTSGTRHKM